MGIIKLNCIGKIISGDDLGFFVKILDDSRSTGGYLILTCKDNTFTTGYDNWVENWECLEEYFKESEWSINWSNI